MDDQSAGNSAGKSLGRRLTQRILGGLEREIEGSRREILKELRDQRKALDRERRERAQDVKTLRSMLQLVYDDEPGNRRRLYELRRSESYELAFTEPEPLVSIVLPTYHSVETLRERAIPSILGQTYPNLELVIVGDDAVPETGRAISEFADERITYVNRNRRGPYPPGPRERWLVAGSPPYNEAVQLARGRWIAWFSDDDAMRPHHLETLVRAAQRDRHEVCYGQGCWITEHGRTVLGTFPPEDMSHIVVQACIYHSGLSFLELELADAVFDEANDQSLVRRMLRAGARFGFVEEIVTDKYVTSRPGLERAKRGAKRPAETAPDQPRSRPPC